MTALSNNHHATCKSSQLLRFNARPSQAALIRTCLTSRLAAICRCPARTGKEGRVDDECVQEGRAAAVKSDNKKLHPKQLTFGSTRLVKRKLALCQPRQATICSLKYIPKCIQSCYPVQMSDGGDNPSRAATPYMLATGSYGSRKHYPACRSRFLVRDCSALIEHQAGRTGPFLLISEFYIDSINW
ncbi:hypothetical protein MSAN_00970600 [Mycena sanguinolenta]|uniref:Uncharacterized protein n=1 Tax=Mycena sanguinolenta TaxID=230812 RepID=A0A8H6YTZ2_9AGAR|nr:hypothetical protein MSAN_00970600 [Mycena sanguinolenta]